MKITVELEFTNRELQAIRHEIRDAQTGHSAEYSLPINKNDLADSGTVRAWVTYRTKTITAAIVRDLETYESVKDHNDRKKIRDKIKSRIFAAKTSRDFRNLKGITKNGKAQKTTKR